MQTCTTCNLPKPLDAYYFNRRVGRFLTRCKDCHNAYGKEYQKANMSRKLETNKAWRARNRDRIRIMKAASNLVQKAIREGWLKRDTTCSKCGQDTYVEASHEDYSKPYDIRWLCRSCHRKEDTNNRKTHPSLTVADTSPQP